MSSEKICNAHGVVNKTLSEDLLSSDACRFARLRDEDARLMPSCPVGLRNCSGKFNSSSIGAPANTSAEEVQQLNAALRSSGQEELLRVLSRLKAGRITAGNGDGLDANAVISVPQKNGTKIIVLDERNLNFYELRYGTRSKAYRFNYAEIFLRRRGNSEGTFIPAAKIRQRDGNTWEVENFGVFPARLMGLQARGGVGLAR